MLAEKLPLAGFSVTIPHKQKILRYLDVVDPLARRIGAVNTVWRKAGKWRGTNTDADGVITVPLERRMRLQKSSVLMVGNGGAARGAAYALSESRREARHHRPQSRSRARARQGLRRRAALARTGRSAHVRRAGPRHAAGHVPESGPVFFQRTAFPRNWCSTWSTIRSNTLLARKAKDQGATVIPGLEMFLEQASRQFEIWTGENAPRAVMEKAALEALDGAQVAHA